MARDVRLVGRSASAMGDDDLALLEETVGHSDPFIEESAGIVAEVEDEALNVVLAEALEIVLYFAAGVLIERLDIDVHDARPDEERILDALARDLVADDVEGQ